MANAPSKKPAAKPTKEALAYCNDLINFEFKRLGNVKYDKKMLKDPNRGHWENTNAAYRDATGTFYRDPILDIKEGYIGINFGSRNVTVAMLDENSLIAPLRIGAKDFQKPIDKSDFQIPAILHFKNLENFLTDYKSAIGRPMTQWADLATSHTVIPEYLRASSNIFSSFMYDIKPWASKPSGHLRIKDKTGKMYDLHSFLALNEETEFNPVELYAYYLGSFINNMNNGIHLKYILACPKVFEQPALDKLLESFRNGIKKSLPVAILENEEIMQNFSVEIGIAEATAYGLTALTGYNIQPTPNKPVFYGVFDIGAYTTNFSFGLYKFSTEDMRYTYTVDELGSRGNKYLGGEILLEALAYEVLTQHQKILLKKRIQFTRPKDGKRFIGEDAFISNSEEAKRNTVIMINTLRPILENIGSVKAKTKIVLFDREGFKRKIKFKLKKRDLIKILETRVEIGLNEFFEFIKLTCARFNVYPEKIHIFLGGNCSKSLLVEHLSKKVARTALTEWNGELLNYYKERVVQVEAENKAARERIHEQTIKAKETLDMYNQQLEDSLETENDPLDSDPLDSDPLDSDPLDSDPLDSDPLDSDPLDSDPLDPPDNIDDALEDDLDPLTAPLPEPPDYVEPEEYVEIELPTQISLKEDIFDIFPYIGTNNSLAKMKELHIALTESNYFATMGAMGVAFGVLKGRQGGKLLITDYSKSEHGHIPFQYYVGDCDANNHLKLLVTPHTPYEQWVKYIPATSLETEIYYTIYPSLKGHSLSISKAKKAILRIDESELDHAAFLFIRAISPSKLEYVVGNDDFGEVEQISDSRELVLDY
ncbi:MAG: hypothetical protein ATN31_03300 [Candidatus Epulonipiscioides saccharophilum]|nr:MAG: hypothetical protein ATN31_03300 [Epulopiscium sp. AS2M-Bin001]